MYIVFNFILLFMCAKHVNDVISVHISITSCFRVIKKVKEL